MKRTFVGRMKELFMGQREHKGNAPEGTCLLCDQGTEHHDPNCPVLIFNELMSAQPCLDPTKAAADALNRWYGTLNSRDNDNNAA
jgi:hypothetical protein